MFKYVFDYYKKIVKYLLDEGYIVYIQSTLYLAKKQQPIAGYTPEIVNQSVKKLNKLLKKFVKNSSIERLKFIDLNRYFVVNGYMKDVYTFEGTHLNGKGYKEYMKIIMPYMRSGFYTKLPKPEQFMRYQK